MASASEPKSASRRWLLPAIMAVLLGGVLLYAILNRDGGTAAGPAPTPAPITTVPPEEIVDSIHVPTGLKVAEGFETVRAQCTPCHSGKLVAQNRATRSGWQDMIRWMQETQGLWPLGDNEAVILDYLAAHYGPQETGRRANLKDIEWYVLDLE